MFSFFGSIIGKITSAVASAFIAVGLISAPASVAPQPTPTLEGVEVETGTSTVQIQEETERDLDIKAELDALKKQLADEQKKRKDLEKKVAPPAPKPTIITPPPTPVIIVPTPTPTPTTPPTPTPTPTWPPAESSTVDIKRSMLSSMNFNSHLTCDQLALVQSIPPSQKDLCKLYKDNQGTDKYTWNIIEDIQ